MVLEGSKKGSTRAKTVVVYLPCYVVPSRNASKYYAITITTSNTSISNKNNIAMTVAISITMTIDMFHYCCRHRCHDYDDEHHRPLLFLVSGSLSRLALPLYSSFTYSHKCSYFQCYYSCRCSIVVLLC